MLQYTMTPSHAFANHEALKFQIPLTMGYYTTPSARSETEGGLLRVSFIVARHPSRNDPGPRGLMGNGKPSHCKRFRLSQSKKSSAGSIWRAVHGQASPADPARGAAGLSDHDAPSSFPSCDGAPGSKASKLNSLETYRSLLFSADRVWCLIMALWRDVRIPT